jgi:hypothetical protein
VSKKAAKSPAKKSVTKSAPEERLSSSTVSFGPVKKELAHLRGKLQTILDREGENLTIQDIILKIDKLDRVLICQTIMTRSF